MVEGKKAPTRRIDLPRTEGIMANLKKLEQTPLEKFKETPQLLWIWERTVAGNLQPLLNQIPGPQQAKAKELCERALGNKDQVPELEEVEAEFLEALRVDLIHRLAEEELTK